MSDPVHALILDLLEWVAPSPRRYSEVIAAWRTSCPRLPVWEEASSRDFIELRTDEGNVMLVCLTSIGREFLKQHRGIEPARP